MNKFVIITISIALMIAAIVIIDKGINASQTEAIIVESTYETIRPVTSEKDVYRLSKAHTNFDSMPHDPAHAEAKEEYYKRRAYQGAPPRIPHELVTKKGIGAGACLKCHEHGGYTAKFEAYAPITPHPEFLNCRQCHVPILTEQSFTEGSGFEGLGHPTLQNKALISSPPTIPHDLQNRTDCLSCHGGAGGMTSIRVSHPYRANCVQCHTPNTARKEGISESFTRPTK
jgi:cytochrome c-type protein NapB